jgi:hypothetical protein
VSAAPTDDAFEQGVRISAAEGERFVEGVRAAVDYRGDVTIQRRDGTTIEGYLFDAVAEGAGAGVRLLPPEGDRVRVPLSEVAAIEFSGKDTASGRTWENWVRRYVAKRLAGERADLESEPLA